MLRGQRGLGSPAAAPIAGVVPGHFTFGSVTSYYWEMLTVHGMQPRRTVCLQHCRLQGAAITTTYYSRHGSARGRAAQGQGHIIVSATAFAILHSMLFFCCCWSWRVCASPFNVVHHLAALAWPLNSDPSYPHCSPPSRVDV